MCRAQRNRQFSCVRRLRIWCAQNANHGAIHFLVLRIVKLRAKQERPGKLRVGQRPPQVRHQDFHLAKHMVRDPRPERTFLIRTELVRVTQLILPLTDKSTDTIARFRSQPPISVRAFARHTPVSIPSGTAPTVG